MAEYAPLPCVVSRPSLTEEQLVALLVFCRITLLKVNRTIAAAVRCRKCGLIITTLSVELDGGIVFFSYFFVDCAAC